MSKLINIIDSIIKKIPFFSAHNFNLFYNLGVIAYKKRDFEKALIYFNKALEQDKIKPQVYYNLALTLQCINDYDNAIKNYNTFLKIKPDDYDGLFNIALIYNLKGDFESAIKFFEKCIKLKKEADTIQALVLAYIDNNQAQKALELIKNLLKKNSDDINLSYEAAKVFENKNFLSKNFTYLDMAIKIYDLIIEADPNYYKAYMAISICYAKKGEWEKSVEFCTKALSVNPKSYEANNQMGLVHYCFDEVEEAIKYYETAFKLKPKNDYKIYSNLGYAYEKAGKYEKAIKVFDKLVKRFPNIQAKDEIKNHLRVLKTL